MDSIALKKSFMSSGEWVRFFLLSKLDAHLNVTFQLFWKKVQKKKSPHILWEGGKNANCHWCEKSVLTNRVIKTELVFYFCHASEKKRIGQLVNFLWELAKITLTSKIANHSNCVFFNVKWEELKKKLKFPSYFPLFYLKLLFFQELKTFSSLKK